MNKTLLTAISLCVGGVAGFFVAKLVYEEKYKQLADEEIASVKRAFRKSEEKSSSDRDIRLKAENPKEYADSLQKLGYRRDSEPPVESKPRVISPDEFGSLPEYEEISLTLYSDGVVADENDHALDEDEVKRLIGSDALSHFGEYEEDSVFIRNDAFKTDYEILLDHKSYAQLLEERPYLSD